MKSKTMKHLFCRSAFAACLMGTAVMWQSCEDENLTGQPSWLGNSIYERLQEEGNYTTTLKLIDDLGLTEVLSHTGSKTLFVADDAAFEEWFRTNDWGVRSYEELRQSPAKQKLLFNSSMVNNAYLVELLSNVSGTPPQSGLCMRRATSLSIYDSVYIMKPADMPAGELWDKYRGRSEGIVLLKDATTPPMIHFLPKFMEYHKFTELDLSLLTNGQATSLNEAWVNGKQVIERDITCKNGYIHKVSGVLTPNDNMAEIIRKLGSEGDQDDEGTSIWSKFIDRFAAPYYAGNTITNEYRRLYGGQDSVYVLRYLSNQSSNGSNKTTPDGETAPVVLPFDPGWNQYMYSNTSNYDMHYDAAMMIVPTNGAVQRWFDTGSGKSLKDEFGTLEAIPNQTLIELLNVNMIDALTGKVPSKFDDILDPSTQEALGIKPADVKSSYMGCNGVVFVVDSVFSPYSYSSVVFPAMVRERLFKTIYWGIDYEPTSSDTEPTLYFKPFLNSKLSHYSLMLPDNQAMMQYLDPVYYGTGKEQSLLKFEYDSLKQTVQAKRITCNVDANGEITASTIGSGSDVTEAVLKNRMRDMIDNMIIVGEIKQGQEFYKTKSGSYIRVKNPGVEGMMTIQGAWQMQHGGKELKVTKIYHQDNGEAYQLEGQMPLTSTKSLYMTLKEQPEYKQFFDLANGSDATDKNSILFSGTMENTKGEITGVCANSGTNFNFTLFDNFNYTVYVPKNDSVIKLIDNGILPTWTDFKKYKDIRDSRSGYSQNEKDSASVYCDVIKKRINNFIRYHVHDNSLIIGGETGEMDYETMMINEETRRFYTVKTNVSATGLQVKDVVSNEWCNVVKDDESLYNNICRDYWFSGGAGSTANPTRRILMDSDATVHLIDGILRYETDAKLGSWEKEALDAWHEFQANQKEEGGEQ